MKKQIDTTAEKISLRELWQNLRRLLTYLKGSPVLLLVGLVAAVGGTFLQVLLPKILGDGTNMIVAGLSVSEGINFSHLLKTLILAASLMVGSFLASFLQQRVMLVIAQKITRELRQELKNKLNRVDLNFYDQHSHGYLMSVATNDLERLASTLERSLTEIIANGVKLVGVIGFMLALSWQLTLVAMLIIPASMLVMKGLSPYTQKNYRQYLRKQGELNTKIEESYQGFDLIKSFNQEEVALETFAEINEEMYETGRLAQFFGGSMMPSMLTLQNIIYVLIAVLGGMKVISGQLNIGEMQAFLQYSGEFSQPLVQMGQIWNELIAANASAERIFNVLDVPEMSQTSKPFPNQLKSKAKVEFKDVSFGYGEELLMENFNLTVQAGEMIAIVGQTGAGKTTFINLLERFYYLNSGAIYLNGIDSRNLSEEKLRQQLGMVLQETWLFAGTIYDNLKYGNPNASEADIYQGAQAAHASEFIESLPDGYQTLINQEGSNLSQGQKQLLTLARAFIANPDILILDEATSNVDSRTELVIQEGMKDLLNGRTSFVVAHRLSTIYQADRILVMKAGAIVESGTHQELLALQGEYSEIYHSQFAETSAA